MKPNQREEEMKLNIGYSGLAASLYDLWWGEKPLLDDAFYRRMLEQLPGPALEVGCGTGRLLIPYLRDGFEVEGVDCSAEMLALCQKKAEHFGLKPLLYEQFMQKLDLPRHYRTIYIPFRSFQLLIETPTAKADGILRTNPDTCPNIPCPKGRLVVPRLLNQR